MVSVTSAVSAVICKNWKEQSLSYSMKNTFFKRITNQRNEFMLHSVRNIRAFFPMFSLWFLILFRCALKISSFSACAFSCSAHLFFLWMRDFVFPNDEPTSNIRGWCGGSFPLSLFFRCLAGPALKLFYLRNAVWNQKPVESTIHAQIVFFFSVIFGWFRAVLCTLLQSLSGTEWNFTW